MGKYTFHKHTKDDLFGLFLVRVGIFVKKLLAALRLTDRFYERLSKHYRYPKNVEFESISLQRIKIETVKLKNQPERDCLLQLHGGAYIYEFNDNYRRMALQYLKIHPTFKVYSPYYALAPKYPFPYALNEAFTVYQHLLTLYKPERIIIQGDSAGGGLALALAYKIYDEGLPQPKAIITMSAWTDFLGKGESYKENAFKDPFFKNGELDTAMEAYAGKYPYNHEKISPKYGDYTKLPPLLMFVGGNELIKSDTLDIGLNHEQATVHEFEKMFHVYPLAMGYTNASRETWRIIKHYLNEQLEVNQNEK